jgi:tRNA-modifying protein YgfZ
MDEPHSDELRAGIAAAGLGAVSVTGEDRVSFLHNVLTHDIVGLASGEVRGALYLDPHGAPLAIADVAVLDERIVLVTPTTALATTILETLGARTFIADVRFAVIEAASRSLRGEEAPAVADKAGIAVSPGRVLEVGEAILVGRVDGLDVVGSRDDVEHVTRRLLDAGASEVALDAIEAWRIAQGTPAWGTEIRPPHLPEEAGLLPTHVHLDKGCYPGQEAVARMWMLGRPRRRLARVVAEGEAAPGWTAGEGRSRAEVTSTSTYRGERRGLAYVPYGATPGERFEAPGGAIEIVGFVGDGLEIPGHDPAVVRRRDRRAT